MLLCGEFLSPKLDYANGCVQHIGVTFLYTSYGATSCSREDGAERTSCAKFSPVDEPRPPIKRWLQILLYAGIELSTRKESFILHGCDVQ